MTVKQRALRHPLLVMMAICIGIGIAGADSLLFNQALARPMEIEEPVTFCMRALLIALPFLALSMQEKQHVSLWLAAFASSAALAWWWLQKGVAYQRSPDGSGADIGGALIMLVAPFVLTAVCLRLNRTLSGQKANSS